MAQREKIYGLIGYPLGHSFSRGFFEKKFENENIKAEYLNFELKDINEFMNLISSSDRLSGLNVTIPYKTEIIPFLNELDDEAKKIGAVNVIKFINTEDGVKLKGYNTDIIGFKRSISELIKPGHRNALVLGTGGASKSVIKALTDLGIEPTSVSRNKKDGETLSYQDVTPEIIKNNTIIVNTTPLGMFPHTEECPSIPYNALTDEHICFDLIYNPEQTLFLKKAKDQGATIKNGMDMLIYQALAAWDIWNSE